MEQKILRMGNLAASEVAQAKQAFELRDIALAENLVEQDEQINKLNRECFQLAVATGVDHDRREWAMTMMLVARALERIGDNAVDIGEQVAFVVTGLFREFPPPVRVGQTSPLWPGKAQIATIREPPVTQLLPDFRAAASVSGATTILVPR
jgi:hypothetical protein